jgi:hypothetical protein
MEIELYNEYRSSGGIYAIEHVNTESYTHDEVLGITLYN